MSKEEQKRMEYERHQTRLLAAYPRVSAHNMLTAIDAENKKREDEAKERKDRQKRSFEEAFKSAAAAAATGEVKSDSKSEAEGPPPSQPPNIGHEIPIGPLGLEEQDDDAFNRLCENYDHLSMMTVLTARLVRNCEREARQNRIVPLLQIMLEGRASMNGDSKISQGEARYMRVSAMLDEIARVARLRREHAQQTFITEFQIACAPLIYGDDWETEKVNFMSLKKLSRIDRMVLCMAPRRFGKTWAIAWFCLAFILVVEQKKIAIFSQNQRTSAAICETLHQWLFCIPGGPVRSCSDAKTRVSVISEEALSECRMQKDKTKHPSRSSITALPCSVNGRYIHTSLPCPRTNTPPHRLIASNTWRRI